MRKIAIYARVSTNNGTQDYQRQINDLKRLILSHGYSEEQIEIFAERISGYKKNTERPELIKMLTLIKGNTNYFEMIYCTEISRLGRNPSETRKTIDELSDLGVSIFIQSLGRATLDKDGKRDGIMNIILQVLLEFANSESEQMKNRSKSGLLNSAKSGKAGGSKHLPYGYRKDENKMLVVDEEEAVIVQEIFNLYLQGNGVKVINGILNARNIPTRYNKAYAGQTINFNIAKEADKIRWSDKTVLDILMNTLYKGQRRFKNEIIPAPRIVSDEVFDECERIRKTKTHRNNLTTYTYLLKDIIECGCCGRNYYGKYKPVDKGDKVYVCSSSLVTGKRCENKGINIMLLETALFNELVSSDTVLNYLSNTQDIRKEVEKDIAKLSNQLNNEKSALPTKVSERERLLDLRLSDGISAARFKERDDKLTTQIANIEKKIKLLKKDLTQKKIMLAKQSEVGATKNMLIEAGNNRVELQGIFKQIFHKVVILSLSDRYIMALVYVQINGVVLEKTLKIVIDRYCIRKKRLMYCTLNMMVNEPILKKGKLYFDRVELILEVLNSLNFKAWKIVGTLLEVEPISTYEFQVA